MLDQTHWLVPVLAAALGGTLLLASVYYYLYARYRQRYLGVWSLAWSVYAFRFVAELIETHTGFSSGAAVASLSVTLFSSILLLSGTHDFLSKPLPRAWVAAGAAGMLWMLLATLLEADFLILATPTALVTATGYLWTGWVILHSRMIKGTGKHLAGWAFSAWAIVNFLYPVFGKMDPWAEVGFLTSAVLETSVAVGFLLMYFEGSRAELGRSEERLRQVVQHMPVMLDAFNEKMNLTAWNLECERVTGYSSPEIINNPHALEMLYPDPEKRAKMLAEIEASGFYFRNREWSLTTKTGEVRAISWSNISKEFPIPGWQSWAVGVDISDRRKAEQELRTRALQQEAVARLGQRALEEADLGELFNEAVHTVGRTLPVEYCEVLELLPQEDKLVIRATLPGIEDLIGQAVIEAGQGSQAGYTLQLREPVVMPDIHTETRFTPNHLMHAHGIVSGMSVVIEGRERPFGVLNASSKLCRHFTENDINFLKSTANILAAVIERKQAEDTLHRSKQAAQKSALEESVMAEIGRIIGSTLKIEEVYNQFATEVKKVLPFDRIAISLIDFDSQTVSIQYVTGLSVEGRQPGDRFPLTGTAIDAVVESGRGMLLPALPMQEIEARFPGHLPARRAGIQATLLAPLISKGKAFGALALLSADPDQYTEREIPVAENVAAQISGAIAHARLFAEHERMADALRQREASLRSIFRVAPIGIGVVHDRIITQVNDRICEMLGYTAEELVGNSARLFYPTDEDFELVGREKYLQIQARGTGSVETRWQRKDGAIIDVLLSSTPMDSSDWSKGVTFTALDITASKQAEQERLRLEDRLRQAQKMEAIGTLAGGIAHDFNNILAAIIGFAELAKIGAQGNSEATANLAEVLKASFRARDLVRQILTFSRQTETEFRPIKIQLFVKETLKLLRASLPSTIQVRQDLASDGIVLGDPTQIHQVVMNLCTNAYQAMHARGGVLEVNLSETRTGASPPPDLKVLPQGPCLRLRVRDSGPGIDPAIIHRIFDPYFSTKEKGKGTGLGLAVVHGIVKNHRGAIQVSSFLGEGATFDVYFPLVQAAASAAEAALEEAVVGGRERILFVDDEPSIEFLGKQLLGSLGYEVTTCGTAIAALELFRSDPSMFDLVITDMTMPLMTGDRMAIEMMRLRPDLPVIICTGFNELLSKESVQEIGIRALLMKPFLKREAAMVIRQVLDQVTEG
jgi:PAS domain S-box-containing protein